MPRGWEGGETSSAMEGCPQLQCHWQWAHLAAHLSRLLQLEVVRDVCPGYPSPACNSIRGCGVTAGKGDKKANHGGMPRLWG